MSIPREKLEEIGHDARGTCKTVASLVGAYELDVDDDELEDALLDVSTELCRGCGWWFECCELLDPDDESEPGYCDQCREDKS